ncbi:MAG: Nif11-like leader peptide family natural product precursor [Butyrivibrio sp.]|uniref:Nif11-like leader peptide family natural product precursor n=1 Tax=Butyrivibrio sp. TaxID=28121 RepID=UPI0025E40DAC|nr:Nif11-like leader peptide family natural product precursor [Butyrivibrio sp.]MCR5770721.1 Nif11-like leader peptide family natural product precursor [Butyrivibrio sp.]
MTLSETLDRLFDKAKTDDDLRKKLIDTKNSKNPLSDFCDIATANGFVISVMDMINQGEEFYAEIKRSTNGGGENSPDLDDWNDEYSIFMMRLERI